MPTAPDQKASPPRGAKKATARYASKTAKILDC
jgi:hypothetical protein